MHRLLFQPETLYNFLPSFWRESHQYLSEMEFKISSRSRDIDRDVIRTEGR
jgi:hypothetical protein